MSWIQIDHPCVIYLGLLPGAIHIADDPEWLLPARRKHENVERGGLCEIEDHLRRHQAILDNCRATTLITIKEAKPLARILKSHVGSMRDVVTVAELSSEPGRIELPPIEADDLAFLQYTSGSTGNPKGVMLTHANLLANIRVMSDTVNVDDTDVVVSWLPLYHDMGLIGTWMCSLYNAVPLEGAQAVRDFMKEFMSRA